MQAGIGVHILPWFTAKNTQGKLVKCSANTWPVKLGLHEGIRGSLLAARAHYTPGISCLIGFL